jgi:hypothetical protein
LKGAGSCWFLDLEAKQVWYPSCGLISETPGDTGGDQADTVSFSDPEGDLPGYPWFDVQLDCGSQLRAVLDRPDFSAKKVVFRDCDGTIVIWLP